MKLMTVAAAAALACLALPAQAKYTRNVAIVIWNGAEVLDWTGPSEVFESAGQFAQMEGQPAFDVYTVSKTKDPIVSQRFVTVTPQYSIEDAPRPDIIVLPGGGTASVLNDPQFLAWAGDAARDVSAGIDGALHVVARLLGRDVADQTAAYMEYRWTPEAYLAQTYSVLNPSLDARGRTLQQAGIDLRGHDYDAAIAACEGLVTADAGDLDAWYQLGAARYGAGRYQASAEAYLKAVDDESMRGRAYYNAACSYALASQTKPALEALASALEAGMAAQYALHDDDLASLRDDPRFKALIGDVQ
jgi:putative intracellular protease/amidase